MRTILPNGTHPRADATGRTRICHDLRVTTLLAAPRPTGRPDATLAAAADLAREVLGELADADDVGEHLGAVAEEAGDKDKVVTHLFDCTRPGYTGWRWSVTLTRARRVKTPTVNEVVMVPGAEAIVAPEWVPWNQRLRPGDLSPGDLLPVEDEDPRLVPTWSFGDDDPADVLSKDDKAQVRQVSGDLGLGRVRTLSPEGRDMAAERWYAGDGGPEAPLARSAPETCHTCAFLVRLQGPLTEMFGVCANGNANDDGRVVSFDHGCGAHSEVKLARRQRPLPLPDHVFDTLTDDELASL
jgi:hypothetical protein